MNAIERENVGENEKTREREREREREKEKKGVSLRILENFLNVLHLVEKECSNFFFIFG